MRKSHRDYVRVTGSMTILFIIILFMMQHKIRQREKAVESQIPKRNLLSKIHSRLRV